MVVAVVVVVRHRSSGIRSLSNTRSISISSSSTNIIRVVRVVVVIVVVVVVVVTISS